jgi:hypothetical protein
MFPKLSTQMEIVRTEKVAVLKSEQECYLLFSAILFPSRAKESIDMNTERRRLCWKANLVYLLFPPKLLSYYER